ncbi:MAG: hypothetical protein ACXWSL_14975 [Bdellovibrionota bacterium]
MRALRLKKMLLPFAATLLMALGISSALADSTVELSADDGSGAAAQKAKDDDAPAWHRKLWTGSFDTAADASGAAAKQLDGLDFGDCERYRQKGTDNPDGNVNLYWTCVQRKQASAGYAAQARSIQKQQKMMSVVSKAGDLAAVGAVGATINGEMGVKKNNQADTYSSAANIERMAGTASYVTGAADFSMGAYAYVAQKNKLEQMQKTIAGTSGGVKAAASDPAVTSALTNAVEAAKKAAYSHMMWGAGKLAAGYGMMYLAQKSETQAANRASIQDDQMMAAMLAQRQAAGGALPAAQPALVGGPAPFYQNNTPTFNIPNTSGNSGLAATPAAAAATNAMNNGSSTGGSAPISGARMPASAGISGKGGGGGGGIADSAGPGAAAEDGGKEKVAKEAMGSNFEMQLTGGMRPYSGAASPTAASKEEVPNMAALMGGLNGDAGAKSAATGLSPNQVYQDALEGTEGTEQGSMAGVNGKSDSTLFAITKAKLTKMFQVGNVGIPKNVEVKN